jgi:hypothetical protein
MMTAATARRPSDTHRECSTPSTKPTSCALASHNIPRSIIDQPLRVPDIGSCFITFPLGETRLQTRPETQGQTLPLRHSFSSSQANSATGPAIESTGVSIRRNEQVPYQMRPGKQSRLHPMAGQGLAGRGPALPLVRVICGMSGYLIE